MESPYVTKKIARKTLPKLLRFKARRMMEGRKITDMQAIDEALDVAIQAEPPAAKKKTISFFDSIGSITLKRRTHAAKELDDVVYTGK